MFLATTFSAVGQNIVPKDSLAKFNKETLTIKGYRLSDCDIKDRSGKKNNFGFLIRDLNAANHRALVLRVICSKAGGMTFMSGEFDYADLKKIVSEVVKITTAQYPSDDIAFMETIITANSGSFVKSNTYMSDSQKKTTWEIGLTEDGPGVVELEGIDEIIAKFKEAITKMESLM